MVNTGAWPKLMLLAALQLASAQQLVSAQVTLDGNANEVTQDSLESADVAEASCPRLSAQSRSLFLELAEDPTCVGTNRNDSTCYNNHCRVCWTKRTEINKNFECCETLGKKTTAPPATAPVVTPAPPVAAPAVATKVPTATPTFDPASVVEPTPGPTDASTTPSTLAPSEAPTKAPPTEPPTETPTEAPTEKPTAPPATTDVPAATKETPSGSTDSPVTTAEPPSATTETPSGTTEAPSDTTTDAPGNTTTETPSGTTEAPTDSSNDASTDEPTDAPTAPSFAPPVAPTAPPLTPADAPSYAPPVAPSDAPPVSPTDVPTAPSYAPPVAPPQVPWTPSDPTMPPKTDDDDDLQSSSSGSSSDVAGDSDLDPSQDGSSSSDDDGSGSGSGPSTHSPVPDLCGNKLSEGDRNGGVRVITDANCINGGLGCFDYVCRFCKIQDTSVATNFFKCSSFGYHFDGDAFDPDAVTDEPPKSAEPSLDGSNAHPNGWHGQSSLDGSNSGPGDCFHRLSVGDHDAGIRTIPDAKCLYGGLGCFDLECRFCKIADTDKSKHMFKCSNFGYHFVGDEFTDGSGSLDETPAPKPSDAPSNEGSGNDSADGTAEVPTETPTSTTSAEPSEPPQEPTGEPSEEPTGEPTDEPSGEPTDEPSGEPTEVPSGEEPTVGPSDQPTEAPIDEPTSEPTDTVTTEPTSEPADEPTSNPTETPSAVVTTVAPEPTCDSKVSEGDARVGIDMVTDTSCVLGGLGCFGDNCRLCKVRETGDSDHLEWCTDILAAVAAAKTPVVVVVQTEAPPAAAAAWEPSGPCADQVSPGDRAASISAVSDTQCDVDGLGCFGDSCRYCKLEDTSKSWHLHPCSLYAPGTVPPFLQAAATVVSEKSTGFTQMLKRKSVKWSLVSMAFIGAVAAVAMAAIGVNRAVRRLSSSTVVEDAEGDDDDDDDDDDVEAGDAIARDDVEVPPTQDSVRAMEESVEWSNDSAVLSTA